jgi:hypothetical protein
MPDQDRLQYNIDGARLLLGTGTALAVGGAVGLGVLGSERSRSTATRVAAWIGAGGLLGLGALLGYGLLWSSSITTTPNPPPPPTT